MGQYLLLRPQEVRKTVFSGLLCSVLHRETKDMSCIFKKHFGYIWRLDFWEVKGEAEKLIRRLLQLSKLRMMVVGAVVVEMKKMARFGIEFEREVFKDERG